MEATRAVTGTTSTHWLLLTAIAPVAWGTTYFVTRQFLPADAPLWGAVLRALPAGLVLLPFVRRLPHGSWWWRALVLGVLNNGAFFVLVYVAAQLLPTSVASTIMATSAAVMMLLAWPVLGQRPHLLGLGGAALGFVGVAVMLLGGSAAIDPLGVLASLAAMAMSAVGFLLATRWNPARPAEKPDSTIGPRTDAGRGAASRASVTASVTAPDAGRPAAVGAESAPGVLALTSWQLVAGGLVVLPFALAFEGAPPTVDGSGIAAYAYITLVATALAFCVWFAGLRRLPAGTVGLLGLLNPVTGVLLGTLLAGEEYGLRQLAGTALVLTGIVVGGRTRRSAHQA